jgi:hypothetical protein
MWSRPTSAEGGSVYRVTDATNGQPLVVKTLNLEAEIIATYPQEAEVFAREVTVSTAGHSARPIWGGLRPSRPPACGRWARPGSATFHW